jgi:hypothetical protein
MRVLRCSCGAAHPVAELLPIGRQYGRGGEYADLANCPSCGSTICVARESKRVIGPPSAEARRSAPEIVATP